MVGASDAFDKLEQELRRGTVVLAVLSQLRTMRYGYELRQSLVDRGMPIEEGTLYPLLRRLETQGVLRSEWLAATGPSRRYYRLSEQGLELYQRLAAAWRGMSKALDDLLEGEARGHDG
jgi:DNA-binding PadR family transcriptional regulator